MIALSVDLDEAHLYRAVHGLENEATNAPPHDVEAARPLCTVGVARALELAEALDAPLTFFVVAQDLEDERVRGGLQDALARGHAVESHSSTHPYDLVRLSDARLEEEVTGSFARIEAELGVRPSGFRAPGYTIDDRVMGALERAGATFDSSVLPSPPYYAAKLAAMAVMAARGRRSASIAGPIASAFAPRAPYRQGRLLELPILVTRGPRVPVIGTALGWAGPAGARALLSACGALPLLNIELHAIDFAEPSDAPGLLDGLPELAAPLSRRLAAIEAVVAYATSNGRRAVTLAEAAKRLSS